MEKICVLGLGYVGFPLFEELSKYAQVLGIDTDKKKIEQLKTIKNRTLKIQSDLNKSDCSVYIVTVPTPVDTYYKPDLRPLIQASQMIGAVLKKGDLVIYESTVYPGCTEEICVTELEKTSGLKFNIDFEVGYSPERINPGDKLHTLENTIKIISGSNESALERTEAIYSKIVKAGLYKASSIKIAEAAKVIENAQRDVNISFVNELALIFDKMGIDTNEVIDAASTKWNFLPFRPGLVGGHCISVDPYYLTYKAQQLGYLPEVILSGRRVNNFMGQFVAQKVVKLLLSKGHNLKDSKVLILGFAFKENCDDFRNTRIFDMYNEFQEYGIHTSILDPLVDKKTVKDVYNIEIKDSLLKSEKYNAIVLAVGHNEFREIKLEDIKEENAIVFDIKSFWPKEEVTSRL